MKLHQFLSDVRFVLFATSALLVIQLALALPQVLWVVAQIRAVSWFEWVGFVAYLGNIWGNVQLAKRDIKGWIVRLAVNVLWIIYALHTEGGWPMWMNHITFLGINIYGWWEWRNADDRRTGQSAE